MQRLTPNASSLLNEASRISRSLNSTFVGTEHFLAALVAPPPDVPSPPPTLSWLDAQVNVPGFLPAFRTAIAGYVNLTADSSVVIGRSAGLHRALQISAHVSAQLEGPSATEYIFLGILLAPEVDGLPNAVCKALRDAGADPAALSDSLCTRLLGVGGRQRLLSSLPQRPTFDIGLRYDTRGPIEPRIQPSPRPRTLDEPARYSPVRGETHWATPGVLCGKSAGDMKPAALAALVSAGVSTFVCLQTSYTEYGCADYRETLRGLAAADQSFPPHRIQFLHAPIQDMGVLPDASLVALIAELRLLLARGENLYVHCMGGHGRTGTILANLIASIDGVPAAQALRTLCTRHRARGCTRCALTGGHLETREQGEQVTRAQGVMLRGNAVGK